MKNKKTFKEVFGKNPWDPWSAKAGISESASLDKYLKTRGINPEYVTKDVKIAHSKSNAFKQWLMTQREEVEFMEQKNHPEDHEIKVFDYYTRYFHMCPVATEIYEYIEDRVEADSYDLVEGMAKLQDCIFFIEKHLMEKKGSPKEDDLGYLIVAQNIKDQLDRMVAMVNPDMRLEHGYLQGHIENIKKLLDYQNRKDELKIDPDDYEEEEESKEMKEDYDYETLELDEASRCWTGYKPKPGKKAYSPGSCVKEEEVELDEAKVKPIKINIKKSTPTAAERLHQKHQAIRKSSGLPDPEHYKKQATQKQSEINDIKKESVLSDEPKGTLTRVAERKKEDSRSARIVKSVYKKKSVMKEDTYDHEKENKDPARVYGKSPKLEKADEKDSKGDKKPTAAATLSGGTTLTKQNRDTVELDPMMRNRPGQPDVTKKDDKKDDKKKEEKKSNK